MVTTEGRGAVGDIERLLRRLTRFLLRHSAEGAFELRDTVRQVAAAYGAEAEILAIAEGAVLTLRDSDDTSRCAAIRVNPELARLDLVAEGKFLVRRIIAGQLSAVAAEEELIRLERRPAPYPPWLRAAGVVLFSVGFAPSVQATWTEIGYSVVLGAVMAVVFVLAERLAVLRVLLPIGGPVLVGLVAFGLLHAERQPGGPMILMVPALFVLIPGDFLCAATAEIAVGQLTPGAVRLAQAAFTLVEIAAGVLVAAEISGVGTGGLFEAAVPPALPVALIVASWVPFVVGLALTFSARMGDVPWMLALTYLAWGVQFGMTRWVGPTAGTFVAAALLAVAAGYLEISASRPPRIVLILGGFFALTVGALALRGLTTIDGGFTIQGFNDIRDAITQTAALTLGLVVGAAPVQAVVASRVRRMAADGQLAGADGMTGAGGFPAPPG
ncbi:MAG TPA: threonine/serine exporter family protein [Trebonia sp.]